MKRSAHIHLIPVIVGLMLLHFAGCSAIGYAVGRHIDEHNRSLVETPVHRAMTVKKGNEVMVETNDDSIYGGRFTGVLTMEDQEYAGPYNRLKDSLPGIPCWPNIGDFISVHLTSGITLSGEFAGYDLQFTELDLRSGSGQSGYPMEEAKFMLQYCLIHPAGDPNPAKAFVRDIDRIQVSNADTLGGRILQELARAGRLPLRSEIVIENLGRKTAIPVDKTVHLASTRPGNAKWIGLGIGATIDAGILATAIGLAIALSDFTIMSSN